MATPSDFFICDMHSHILPGIDDGSKSPQMTLELLRQASEQGVDVMVCTPHYYPQESIESFLGRRKIAVDGLLQAVEMADFRCPNFCFGAEVAYFSGLTGQTDLHRLCIQGTRYMLLELPFGLWPADIFRNLQEMRSVQGIIPIIAHLERYLDFVDKKQIRTLREMDLLLQMNGAYILGRRSARRAKRLLERGYIDLLGSDCHDPQLRPQILGTAMRQLQSWKLEGLAEKICDCGRNVLGC